MSDHVAISLDPASVNVAAGGQASVGIIVRNRSDAVEHYQLLVEGAPPGWCEVAPDQVAAFALQVTHATLTVHPPPAAAGATYHLMVRARSHLHPEVEGSAVLDVSVPVQAVPAPPMPQPVNLPEQRLVSQMIDASAEAQTGVRLPPGVFRWRLRIRNAGRTLEAFSVCARGARLAWLSLEPPALTLKPDETGESALTVGLGADTAPGPVAWALYVFSQSNISEGTELPMRCEAPANIAATLTAAVDAPVRAVSAGGEQLELTAGGGRIGLAAGNRGRLPVSLLNRSGSRLPMEIAVEGPPHSWLALSQSTATLLMGDSLDVTVALAPPADAPLGLYPLQIRARGRDDPALVVHLQVLLEMSASTRSAVSQLVLSADRERLRVAPGASAEVSLVVQNLSTSIDQVTFHVEGVAAAWAEIIPPVLPVFAQGQKATARLVLRPPRDLAQSPAGTHTLRVVGVSQEHAGLTVRVPLEMEIPFSGDYTLQLKAPESCAPLEARYRLEVLNAANAPLRATFSASDAAQQLEFKFDPLRLDVAAGASGATSFSVRMRQPLAEKRPLRIDVTAQGEYLIAERAPVIAPAHTVTGEFEQVVQPPPVAAAALPPALELVLAPAESSGAEQAHYTVGVRNLTPRAVTVQLRAETPGELTYAFKATDIQLAPAGQANVPLTVRAPKRLAEGQRMAHPVGVSASVLNESSAPITAHASFVQVGARLPVLSRRTLVLAALACAVLFVCVGLPAAWICCGQVRPAPTAQEAQPDDWPAIIEFRRVAVPGLNAGDVIRHDQSPVFEMHIAYAHSRLQGGRIGTRFAMFVSEGCSEPNGNTPYQFVPAPASRGNTVIQEVRWIWTYPGAFGGRAPTRSVAVQAILRPDDGMQGDEPGMLAQTPPMLCVRLEP